MIGKIETYRDGTKIRIRIIYSQNPSWILGVYYDTCRNFLVFENPIFPTLGEMKQYIAAIEKEFVK